MKLFLVIVAFIAFLTSAILFLAPRTLVRAGEVFNKVLGVVDMAILTRRWFWGIVFVIAGAYIFYVAIN